MIMLLSIIMILFLGSIQSQGGMNMSEQLIIHKAENKDPNPDIEGEKPYEMEGRKEERIPLAITLK